MVTSQNFFEDHPLKDCCRTSSIYNQEGNSLVYLEKRNQSVLKILILSENKLII